MTLADYKNEAIAELESELGEEWDDLKGCLITDGGEEAQNRLNLLFEDHFSQDLPDPEDEITTFGEMLDEYMSAVRANL